MKRLAGILWSIFCVAIAITLPYYLTTLYLTISTDMPYWVDIATRSGFRFLANNDMPDPDIMSLIALFIYFAISMAISGAIIGVAGILVWRRFLSSRLR